MAFVHPAFTNTNVTGSYCGLFSSTNRPILDKAYFLTGYQSLHRSNQLILKLY